MNIEQKEGAFGGLGPFDPGPAGIVFINQTSPSENLGIVIINTTDGKQINLPVPGNGNFATGNQSAIASTTVLGVTMQCGDPIQMIATRDGNIIADSIDPGGQMAITITMVDHGNGVQTNRPTLKYTMPDDNVSTLLQKGGVPENGAKKML